MQQVRGFTLCMEVLFCKNTDNAVKIFNSAQFTALTAKKCKKYEVKISFFSPHFLRKFTAEPRLGESSYDDFKRFKFSVNCVGFEFSNTLFVCFSVNPELHTIMISFCQMEKIRRVPAVEKFN